MRITLLMAACGAWIMAASPVSAAQLSDVAVEGLRLGMSRGAVGQRYPYMHFEDVPYLDDRVEDRYAILYGSLVLERVEGHAIRDKDGRLLVIRATFAGDDRLIAVGVFAEHETMDCRRLSREMRDTYGAATIDNAPAALAWIEKSLSANRALRFTCYDRKSYGLTLIDHGAQAENLRTIRKKLEPYVLETLQQIH